MKSALPILLTIGIIAGALSPNATATPINGSFESSSFSGWQLDMSRGQAASRHGYRAAGTANVMSSWGQQVGLNPMRSAMEGNRFAVLGSLADGNFTGHRTYNISLRQELSLTGGTLLSGWASFFNGDTDGQDSAWVKIFDDTGAKIATPWLERSGCESTQDASSAGYRDASPWTQWSWQVPADGNYTLSFGLTTADDNNFASYGFFDGFLVSPPTLPVPEPSVLALVTFGAGLLLRQRRVISGIGRN